jgi:DNA polymerase-3 subunit delta'
VAGFHSITGQDQSIEVLKLFLYHRSIPHALLFTGIEGIGKSSIATALAMACNCPKAFPGNASNSSFSVIEKTDSCGVCRVCRKILSGNHPDIISVEPEGLLIKIGKIRELSKKLSLKPNEARFRVVMIHQAHCMNPEASNALLKILEEPPEQTLLILVTQQASDLLPTILSRCHPVRFHPLARQDLKTLLIEKNNLSEEKADSLASLARGSYTTATAMIDEDWTSHRNWLFGFVAELPSKPVAQILAFSEKMAEDKDLLFGYFEMLKIWVRDLAVFKYAPEMVINKDITSRLQHFSAQFSIDRLLKIEKMIEQAIRNLRSNANPRLLVENLLFEMV